MKFDFYESPYDALQKSIAISGKTLKANAKAFEAIVNAWVKYV